MAKTHINSEPLRFNLKLSDPVTNHLDRSRKWQGVAGDYVITLGPESSAAMGNAENIDTLAASVGAFTRLWLGVRNASALSLTDELSGSDKLLCALDEALRLPSPHFGWDF